MDDRTLPVFNACSQALQECRKKGTLTKHHFIFLAMQYGKFYGVTQEEIKEMMEKPLKSLLGVEE